MSTRDEIIARHKKEQKDLIATITGLKKQATKKTRKNVMNKCVEMQSDLDKRQQDELSQLDGEVEQREQDITPEELLAQLNISENSTKVAEAVIQAAPQMGKPKRNRQKERMERKKQEIEKIKAEAQKEANDTIDYRKIEQESMDKILALNNLVLNEIKPDGHCLFASIQDQLSCRHGISIEIKELRARAADHIQENSDQFIPFLFDETTGELHDLDLYLENLRNTAMWGSDMEILALAKEFDCPISIYMAGSSTVRINEDGQNQELKIGFYKNSYALGEHYNSLRDST